MQCGTKFHPCDYLCQMEIKVNTHTYKHTFICKHYGHVGQELFGNGKHGHHHRHRLLRMKQHKYKCTMESSDTQTLKVKVNYMKS